MAYVEPPWLTRARQDYGKTETLGPNDSPWLRATLARLGAAWLVGQPWCGGAVALWMKDSDIAIPKAWYRAKAWLEWGHELHGPAVGAVVVFDRSGGGHVGLCYGKDARGRLLVYGGNQGDKVCVAPFDQSRVLGYRWPLGPAGLIPRESLPLITGSAGLPSSTNEA